MLRARLALILLTAMTACSSSPAPSIPTYHAGAPALMASSEGVVKIVNGCVYLSQADGSLVLAIFRDAEVGWKNDALAYAGKSYKVGDHLAVTGGRANLDRLSGLSVPSGCDTNNAFVVAPAG